MSDENEPNEQASAAADALANPPRQFLLQFSTGNDRAAAGFAWVECAKRHRALIVELETAVEKLTQQLVKRMNANMEASVAAELARYGPAGRSSLAEGALVMARALDQFAASADTASHLSAIVKAHQELRVTLASLKRTGAEAGQADASAGDAESLGEPI